jgi:predicted XRE-type DNA-binding protein
MGNKLPELKKRRVVDATGAVVAESVVSSGNVFADLGMPNAEEHKLKSGLMLEITKTVKARGLTQSAAAKIVGVSQGRLSEMMNGQFRSVSVEQLFKILNRLGRHIEVRVHTRETEDARMELVA